MKDYESGAVNVSVIHNVGSKMAFTTFLILLMVDVDCVRTLDIAES